MINDINISAEGVDSIALAAEQSRLLLARPAEQVEQVELRGGLAQQGGLHPAGVPGPVEVHSGQLSGLNVPPQLGSGLGLPVLAAEAEPGLQPWAQPVRVPVVDAARHEAADPRVAVSVQLQPASEGGAQAAIAVTHLSGDPELRHDLTVGIDCCAQAGSEAEVTVASEQAVCGGHSPDGPEAAGRQPVLQALVRVGLGQGWQKAGWQEPAAACQLLASSRGGGGGGGRSGGGLRCRE